ncbi:hypothetical protein GMORB2_4754 [Geosmithia morbida]|uniref:Vacuolar membrane protein n=1 Tax=Geosmithia morbida TaxID=1094350 RepID=A0A9P4YP28_9HYPO|nr:uncharacterized protein GMORB2_4754 [Geosmithia morbida]KAF4119440.1 hypothetical protein GMORB2_4754 [Geosmithia morbida]
MGPGFAYAWLWAMLILSVAVYALDSFTAVNLLIFDKWSSNIEPGIPLKVSKWIFSGCIILSFLNLGYEAVRAVRVMKRRNVAECYLDSLAVRWESARVGRGQGYRRFLVFAELTKGKKGGQYVALFTYFSLQSWIRVLICSGPRQVINAFTFKSLYESRLAVNESSVEGSLSTFFEKIGALAKEDYQQSLVLGSMAFTLIVWIFSLLFLLAAVLCYITFLWHWIPRADGGLTGYCERKINEALKRIVTEKVNVALAKGEQKQIKAGIKAARKNGLDAPDFQRQATLPTLPNIAPGPPPSAVMARPDEKGDSLPEMPMLGRTNTGLTLPAYTSRPTSPGGIEMGSLNGSVRKPPPSRTGTMASAASARAYDADTSLLSSAAEMGTGRPPSPVPSLPVIAAAAAADYGRGPGTPASQRSSGNGPAVMGHRSNMSNGSSSRGGYGYGYGADGGPMDPSRVASPAPSANIMYQPRPPQPQPQPYYNAYGGVAAAASDGRASPAGSYRGMMPPLQPGRSATGPIPNRGPYGPPAPQRNMTAPMPPRGPDIYDRPSTSQSMRGGTPQPYPGQGQGQGQGQSYGYDVERNAGQRYW